jgi:ribosomal protein S18 acetylase RimI-like enzyme
VLLPLTGRPEIAAIMIRPAAASDVDAIARLHVRSWQTAYRGHMPQAHLDRLDPAKRAALWSQTIEQPATLVLVATSGETLVGFCSLLPSRDADASPTAGEISAIYVDPESWRSGFGSALLEAAIESARRRGFIEVTLWVLTSNTSARAFYEARGLRTDGKTRTEERPGFSIDETRYRRRIVE